MAFDDHIFDSLRYLNLGQMQRDGFGQQQAAAQAQVQAQKAREAVNKAFEKIKKNEDCIFCEMFINDDGSKSHNIWIPETLLGL